MTSLSSGSLLRATSPVCPLSCHYFIDVNFSAHSLSLQHHRPPLMRNKRYAPGIDDLRSTLRTFFVLSNQNMQITGESLCTNIIYCHYAFRWCLHHFQSLFNDYDSLYTPCSRVGRQRVKKTKHRFREKRCCADVNALVSFVRWPPRPHCISDNEAMGFNLPLNPANRLPTDSDSLRVRLSN